MEIPKPDKVQWQFVGCHRKPERSFFWKGKQFPVCARCTGIHIGYLSYPLFVFGIWQLSLPLALLLLLPTTLDGLVQGYFNLESTNWRRFVTGISAGVGMMSIASIIGIFIGRLIKLYFF